MIVDRHSSWLRLVFTLRGSILQRIWRRVLAATLWSVAVTLVLGHLVDIEFTLTMVPFTLIGLALAIFLGFRNNTSYDRFWEGRKLWGRLVNTSRSLTRQILTVVVSDDAERDELEAFRREQVHRLIAYVHSLRHHLRGEDTLAEIEEMVGFDEAHALEGETNRPVALLQNMGDRFEKAWLERGWIEPYHMGLLEESLTDLTDIQGGCERIRATPIPFAYNTLMHRLVAAYCFALPLGALQQLGDVTPLVVLFVAYSFLGLDAIGDEIEDPFGYDPNDLPLTYLATMIEGNLRQRIGEEPPPPVEPDEGGVLV